MESQLKRLGLTKRQLAEDLGYSPEQVTRWKNNPPKHVIVYLDLLLEYRRTKDRLIACELIMDKVRSL